MQKSSPFHTLPFFVVFVEILDGSVISLETVSQKGFAQHREKLVPAEVRVFLVLKAGDNVRRLEVVHSPRPVSFYGVSHKVLDASFISHGRRISFDDVLVN